ncbi:MAG: winged helix-turn-helix transcriptional regulator, partial [Candidatus Obscuribacterales bacterium]|nr:winged helix-turn-helix transcriptional regulator [Candidatus Obscuribacterales bacterium]
EAAGLINRYEYPGKPAKVEYSLNEYGVKLCKIFEQIKVLQDELNGSCQSCTCPVGAEPASEDAICPERRTRRLT